MGGVCCRDDSKPSQSDDFIPPPEERAAEVATDEAKVAYPVEPAARTSQSGGALEPAPEFAPPTTHAPAVVSPSGLEMVFLVKKQEVLEVSKGASLDSRVQESGCMRAWYGVPGHEWKCLKGRGKMVLQALKKMLKEGQQVTVNDETFGPMGPDESRVLLVDVRLDRPVMIRLTEQPLGLEVDKGSTPIVTHEPKNGTVAKEAGIKEGMVLQRINGRDVTDLSHDETINLIKTARDRLPMRKS